MIISVLIAFFAKFLLAFLPSFGIDMGTWLGWAGRLSSTGFSSFYSDAVWTQYTPGFLYYLWLIGKLGIISEMAIKVPVILADIATGLLIWKVIGKVNNKWAIPAFFAYTLSPVTLMDGSIWGQIDGLLTLFLFLSAYFMIEKRNLTWSIVAWSVAFIIKPQSIAVLPAIIAGIIWGNFKIKDILVSVFAGLFVILVLAFPFFPTNPILGLPLWILKMGDFYAYTSVFAFNIWSWIGFWKPDSARFIGISLSVWGSLLLLGGVLFATFSFKEKLKKKEYFYLLFALTSLAFFLFPTRVHERYLFPFFAFLLTAAGISKSKNLLGIFVVTTIASFLNIYYPYAYYNRNFLYSGILYNLAEALSKIVGLTFLAAFFAIIHWEKLPEFKLPKLSLKRKNPVALSGGKLSKKSVKIILIAILAFAFVTRIFNLGSPKDEYFDEVYHAFTAKVILHGDPKAWEWWNTPPVGFAYEWTHPPLAKLGMYFGMKIFGENSFGYRIPGALLGVGSVYLIYLLSKTLFDDEPTALLSAVVYSLDGLALVMSRVGMNDSYLLFSVLLSVYLFLKRKNFLSALFFGFALASKWSSIWAIPILGLIWLRRKDKFDPSLAWFFVMPITVYMLSYIPMFLTGHDLVIWWEMQKQMWWYHTGLEATHPYSSSWWSWPLLIRPIYLYTSDEVGGVVSRIYAMGNPLVFWFGLTSVLIAITYAFTEKNKNLGLVIFSYIIFFVPWAMSPRIMFLYHYLPSLPFLAIASGYVLRRNPGLIKTFLISASIVFIYFYPHWAGLPVPVGLDLSYYWISTWR